MPTTPTPVLSGVFPVLQTPFDEQGRIDWEALVREIDWVFAQGADGVCAAMVSEWLRLTHEERLEYMGVMAHAARGRGAAIASVGAESTYEAVAYARAAEHAGCHAVMAIPPTSFRLPDNALEAYFNDIADAVSIPLIVQDASGYLGAPLSVPMMVRLVEQWGPGKIWFKPEAVPVGPVISRLHEATGGKAIVFDGSGGLGLPDSHRRGIVGTIPGADLVDAIVALWNALERGEERRAYQIYLPLSALVAIQAQAGLDGFVAIEKLLLVERGVLPSTRRRPPVAWEPDDTTRREVLNLYELLRDAVG